MASSDPSPGGDEREVLTGLPNSRPQRRSAKRDRPARGASTRGSTTAKAKPAAKPKARTAAKAASKPKAAPAREPVSQVPPAGYATPRDDAPRGADLIGTAFHAAGELAQIGIVVSGRALKSAIQRLPRP